MTINRALKGVSAACGVIAATAILLLSTSQPSMALANRAIGDDESGGCVNCSGKCNGSENSHATSGTGGRYGLPHPCAAGNSCSVHEFNSSCGGGGGEELGSLAEVKKIPWAILAQRTGKDLQETLAKYRDRWSLNEERHSIQWKDCIGNVVANFPLVAGQMTAALAAGRVPVNTVGELLEQ